MKRRKYKEFAGYTSHVHNIIQSPIFFLISFPAFPFDFNSNKEYKVFVRIIFWIIFLWKEFHKLLFSLTLLTLAPFAMLTYMSDSLFLFATIDKLFNMMAIGTCHACWPCNSKLGWCIVFYVFHAVKMGSDDSLKTWVSDKLMSLLGYSQPTVVQYMIGLCNSSNIIFLTLKNSLYNHFGTYVSEFMCNILVISFWVAAKQAASPADLAGKLVEFGIASTETRAFAEEIFSRVPHKSSGLNVSLYISIYALWKYTAIFMAFV